MAREEILAMKPGRELDALVAEKVMGQINWFSQGGSSVPVPNFSTDISAAWEVRQWLLDNIGGVTLMRLCDLVPEYCEVYRGKDRKEIQVQAETMPEAICKAALLTTMEEE